jgi:hypothetical protein
MGTPTQCSALQTCPGQQQCPDVSTVIVSPIGQLEVAGLDAEDESGFVFGVDVVVGVVGVVDGCGLG